LWSGGSSGYWGYWNYTGVEELPEFCDEKGLYCEWHTQFKGYDTRKNSFICPREQIIDDKQLKELLYYSSHSDDITLLDYLDITSIMTIFEKVFEKEITKLKELGLFVQLHYGYILYKEEE
jgi:hypothetical protein